MRAVLDPNVLVSALLSRTGTPAKVVSAWLAGAFELVVSELLLAELERALAYPKVLTRIGAVDAQRFVALLRQTAVLVADPEHAERRSPDPDDDYLLALAEAENAVVVSGDAHLLGLSERLPILSVRAFIETLEQREQ